MQFRNGLLEVIDSNIFIQAGIAMAGGRISQQNSSKSLRTVKLIVKSMKVTLGFLSL